MEIDPRAGVLPGTSGEARPQWSTCAPKAIIPDRAHVVADPAAAAVGPDRRAERRRRVAEPDLDFREFCRHNKLPQSGCSWDLFAGERYRRGETDIPSLGYSRNGSCAGQRLPP